MDIVLYILCGLLFFVIGFLFYLDRPFNFKKWEDEFDKKWAEKQKKEQEERKKKEEEILHKFWFGLIELCKKENIFLEFFDTPVALNELKEIPLENGELKYIDKNGNDFDKNEMARGRYRYLKMKYDSPADRAFFRYPKIQLLKKDENEFYPWTFAHELGHHFTITDLRNINVDDEKLTNEELELAANHYIFDLAKLILTEEERKFINISLAVYSKHKELLPKYLQ